MTNRILVVDDDMDARLAIKARLNGQFAITEAPNGLAARTLLDQYQFDLVLSDVQMPLCNGLDLSDWISKNRPTPVLLMSAFSNMYDMKAIRSHGAKGLLKKPFQYPELIAAINQIFLRAEPETVSLERDYCRVAIENLYSEKGARFDVYVRLSESKFVKILHLGGTLPTERIQALKARNIQYLYIKKEDFAQILNFNLSLAKAVQKSTQMDLKKKSDFMKNTNEVLMEGIFVKGIDEESFRNASDFVLTSLDIITDHKETFEVLSQLQQYSDLIYAHSLGVATFSIMLGRAIGWETFSTLSKLAIGGLLHDIGKKEIDMELLNRPRHLLRQNERHLIETHVSRGHDILQSLKTMPSDIIDIVNQHHENLLGQGYPSHLDRNRIHPLAKVVQVADMFCEFTIKDHGITEKVSALEAFERMAHCSERFDKQALKALGTLILK